MSTLRETLFPWIQRTTATLFYGVSNTTRRERGAIDPGSAALGALIALAAAWALWGPR